MYPFFNTYGAFLEYLCYKIGSMSKDWKDKLYIYILVVLDFLLNKKGFRYL